MGQQQQALYYDHLFDAGRWRPGVDARNLPWAPVWQHVADRIIDISIETNKFETLSLLDIGCGPGALLDFLPPEVRYTGVDFSGGALHLARERAAARGCGHAVFYYYNIQHPAPIQLHDVYVMCEVLEHVSSADQRGLLHEIERSCLEHGPSEIIITVPNFDDPSHVMHFDRASDVMQHFCDMVVFHNPKVSPILGRDGREHWFMLTAQLGKR